MPTTILSNSTTQSPIENESFWQNHYEKYKMSGSIKAVYCRQNNLNYDRFRYWISKQSRHPDLNSTLIPVKIKHSDDSLMSPVLCTLNFINGCFLKIHDASVLSVVLEKMR